jgi:hypothetical protein
MSANQADASISFANMLELRGWSNETVDAGPCDAVTCDDVASDAE